MVVVVRPIIIFVMRGFTNTSVCPTSENHHKSVTKEIMVVNEENH